MAGEIRKADLDALVGRRIKVVVRSGLELKGVAEGVVAKTGYGAFGGLFVEFSDGDSSIGWNPEDSATVTLVSPTD